MKQELRIKFEKAFPGAFFLDSEDLTSLQQYLKTEAPLATDIEVLSMEKPGEGNMNRVLRINTAGENFILKQARPWVEKYPQINAPANRLAVEYAFYQATASQPLVKALSPEVHWFDPRSNLMSMADLGSSSDFTSIYNRDNSISEIHLQILIQYLEALHSIEPPADFPGNHDMRALNHEHIFNYPFLENNGLDLDQFTSGLSELLPQVLSNVALLSEIKELGEVYLAHGSHLIHGDFYPGSWLSLEENVKVIDPEFAFVGPPEFDLGVLLAHLHLSQHDAALISMVTRYSDWALMNHRLIDSFAGIEVLRRLLGVAQLPLSLDLTEKDLLIKSAMHWIQGDGRPW